MKKQPSRRITRRQFLIGAGATLVGTTLACNRGRGIATTVSAPTTTPTPTTAHSPTPTITPTPSLEGPADLVLLNGKVITVDAADTIAQAVAIKNGRIQAVGSDEAIRALVGPDTETVDLAGRSLTPGLIDAHNHFQVMGLMNG